ncbi:heavy-metal-associated domain-containing protein [Cellvibrio sp. UBA7661]|uniref:heavy-metal-associated domain-containing protein n=1 Tax=Cellvibrio sp. UBA7661 TaxID=1946311 RepID=UPI002F35948C
MYKFVVMTMTCGGCAAAITRAIQSVDASARVNATPANHSVEIESRLSQGEILALLDDAGYPAQPV